MLKRGLWISIFALVWMMTIQAGVVLAADKVGTGGGNDGGHSDTNAAGGLKSVIESVYQLRGTIESLRSLVLSEPSSIPVLSVTDAEFGAIADGAADDTAAIQKALDQANSLGGALVYFPQGTYRTSADLLVYSNTKLLGSNAKLSKQDVTGSYAVLEIAANQSHVIIDGLWIENLKTTGCIGVDFQSNTSDIAIHGNLFTGMKEQSVNINALGVRHVSVTDNRFDGVSYGVLTNGQAKDVEDVRVVNNHFINIVNDAVELNHPSTANGAGTNIVIADNFFSAPVGQGTSSNSGFGVGIAGATHVTISGNVFKNNRYEAIHIEDKAHHISIVGNSIDSVGSSPANKLNSGIYVIDGDSITISGNTISNTADYGIHLEYATGAQAKNTIVTANTVTGSGRGGIRIAGTISNGYSGLIVSENVVTGNTGNGIDIGGEVRDLKLTNNISRGNTGYGLYFNNSGRSWRIEGNSLYGNTLGNIGVNSASVTFPVPLRDNSAIVSSAVSNLYTSWVDTFSLGRGADGILYVTATRDSSADRSTKLYRISWDGTTLTSTLIAKDGLGTLEISNSGLQMNGNTLQLRAYSQNNGTVTFDVQFEGLILMK